MDEERILHERHEKVYGPSSSIIYEILMEFTSEIHLAVDVKLGHQLFAATERSESLVSQIKSTSRTNIEHLRLIYREAIIVILSQVPQFFHFCIMCSAECFLFYRIDWISAFNRTMSAHLNNSFCNSSEFGSSSHVQSIKSTGQTFVPKVPLNRLANLQSTLFPR